MSTKLAVFFLAATPLLAQPPDCTYTLQHAPGGSIIVFRNGTALVESDYTRTGSNGLRTIAINRFANGDLIMYYYSYQTASKQFLPTKEYHTCVGTSTPPPASATAALIQSGQAILCFDEATGGPNAIRCNPNPPYTALLKGMVVQVIPASINNAGTTTLSISGLEATPVKRPDGNDLSRGDLVGGQQVQMAYNGSAFVIQTSGCPIIRQAVAGVVGIERWKIGETQYIALAAWPEITAMPDCPAPVTCWEPAN